MSVINNSYRQTYTHIENPTTTTINEQTQVESTPRSRSKRGIGAIHRRWPQNSTVTIGFIGTTPDQEALVKKGFSEFTPYINLTFKYVAGTDADIRVGHNDRPGLNGYSYVGTDARKAPAGKPTLFIDFNRKPEEIVATTIHEGLHAVGVLHEHQHPERTIEFDKAELLKRAEKLEDPEKTLTNNALDTIKPQKNGPIFTGYDQKSMTHYAFTSKELKGAPEIKKNTKLSLGDIELLSKKMYPIPPHPSREDSIKQLKATAVVQKLWPEHSKVTVSLYGMGDEQKKFVKHNIEKLQPHVNNHVVFTDQNDGDIRISLSADGTSWSQIGTDAKSTDTSQPTMGIHWDANKKKTARAVKHMFAKALGLTDITLPKKSA